MEQMPLFIDAIMGVALLVVGVYLVLPLIVRAMMWADTNAPIDEVDIDELPDDVADYFSATAAELRAMGFARVGCFRMPGLMPGAAATFEIHLSDDRRTMATVNSIAPTIDEKPATAQRYVEFASESAEGVRLHTTTNPQLDAPGPDPTTITHCFRDMTDLRTLLHIHTAWTRAHAPGHAWRTTPLDVSPQQILRMQFERAFRRRARLRAWHQSRHDHRYRLTLKGACLYTWAELPPARQWRRWRRDRQAQALRTRLGM